MVSIFTGLGSGFERGSGATLGGAGLLGSATLGRSGEQVSLNAATGNLLISQSDEFLVGRGPDASIARTYNSLGDASDDNGDNWRQSTDRRVYDLTGTVNTSGSTVKRVAADGSVVTYGWNGTAYVATDGSGAYDTMRYDGAAWTWTDGDSQVSERYANVHDGQWRITAASDTSGNALSFTYNGALLDKVTTANGDYVQYGWSRNNITQIATYHAMLEPDATYAKSIYRMYDAAFDRAPEPDGYIAFMAFLRKGESLTSFGEQFYNSAEYQSRGVGSMGNDDFIEFLYTSILRRPSDPGGKANYVAVLNSGAESRASILSSFAESGEHVAGMATRPGRAPPLVQQVTRTRYGYDGANRLTSVTVDVSPEDNVVGDGKTYVTSYTYDGSSKRVASISQTDGSRLNIEYDPYGRVIRLTQVTLGAPRLTIITYNPGYTTVGDSFNQLTRFDYNVDGSLAKVTAAPAFAGAAAQVSQFGYDGAGNVTSVSDALGAVTTFTHDGSGNVLTTTDPLGNVVARTYGLQNQLLTETRTGSDASGAANSHTTRYAYDAYDRLRYAVAADGSVTEYRYNSFGQQTSTLTFTSDRYDLSSLGSSSAISEATLATWVAAIADRYAVERSETSYDIRGDVASTTRLANGEIGSYATPTGYPRDAAQAFGPITARVNTSVQQLPDGLYRITKTGGDEWWWPGDADATSQAGTYGDFVVHIRPGQANKQVMGGVSYSPNINAAFDTLNYAISFTADGQVGFVGFGTNGAPSGVTYSAGDDFWLVRTGDTISYYRGATLAVAIAAGALHSSSIVNAKYYFDSSLVSSGAVLDASIAWGDGSTGTFASPTWASAPSTPITARVDTAVTQTSDGLTRIQKTSASTAFDADATSAVGASGDFLLRLRPVQSDKFIIAGISKNPTFDANYTNVEFGIEFYSWGLQTVVQGATQTAVSTYNEGETFWLARAGTTLSFYKGATLSAAMSAGPIETLQGVSGTYYFDSSLAGGAIDVAFAPLSSTAAATQAASSDSSRTTYVHDQFGQLLSRTTAGLNTERFVYDGLGRMLASTDLNGATTSIVFDDMASRTVVTAANGYVQTSTYGVSGELLSSTDSGAYVNGGTAYFAYDREGQLRFSQDATGHLAYSVYDAVGRKVADVDHHGALTEYRYDADDRVIATIRYSTAVTAAQISRLQNVADNVDLASIRPADAMTDLWSWTVYDQIGRRVETIDSDGGVTTFEYNASGLLLRSTALANKISAEALTALKASTGSLAVNRLPNSQLAGTAGWYFGYNGSGIADTAAPYTFVHQGKGLIKVDFTATTANQTLSISTNDDWFAVTGGERLAVQSGIEGQGVVGTLLLAMHFRDKDGNVLGSSDLVALTGQQNYDTKAAAFVTVRPNATSARFEWYMRSAAAGTGSFAITEPMVSLATATQTMMPAYTPTPRFDPRDSVSRKIYDSDGRMVGVLDGEGYLTRAVYDAAGRSVSETKFATATDPALRASGSFAQLVASVGTNTADRTSHSVYDGQGLLRFSIDAQGHVVEFVYQGSAEASAIGVVRQTIRYAAPIGSLSTYTLSSVRNALSAAGLATSAANRTSYQVYDTANRIAFTVDASGAVSAYGYDSLGRVIKTTTFATLRSTNTVPDHASMVFWAAGNGDAADRVTRTSYTARGEVAFTIDAEGYVTAYGYDAAGRIVSETRYDNAVSVGDSATVDTVAALAGGPASTSLTSYDHHGRIATTTDALGIVARRLYNSNGTLASIARAYGTADQTVTAYEYDGAGRVIVQRDASGTVEQSVTTFTYDGLGNQSSVTGPTGGVTSFSHDHLGRTIATTDALGGTMAYQYDAFGDVVKTTDARGNASYSYYDTLGRVIATRDAEDYITQTGYTAFGDVASVTRRHNAAIYAASTASLPSYVPHVLDAITSFFYDRLGRVVQTTDAQGASESYTLDAFGQRTATTSMLGGVTVDAYDRRGLLIAETLPISAATAFGSVQATTVTNRFAYDARGNRITMTEAYGLAEQRITSYVYDRIDRLIETRLPAVANATGSGTLYPVETVVYDRRGNVIQTIDAGGARTFSWYDALDRQVALLSATGAYSTTSYVRGTGTGEIQIARIYETQVASPMAPGGPAPAVPSGNLRESIQYFDNLGRLLETRTVGVLTGAWNGSSYAYSVGAVTSTWQYDAAGNVVRATDGTGAVTYSYYDRLGRKAAQVDPSGYLTTWIHDGDGNVLVESRYANKPGMAAGVGADPGAITRSTAISGADRTTLFGYDRNGRRVSERRLGIVGLSVDAAGQLVAQPVRLGGERNPDLDGPAMQLYRLYDVVLGRPPNSWEIDLWSVALAHNQGYASPENVSRWSAELHNDQLPALELVASLILGDSNVQARLGSPATDDATFIRNLYRAAFRREVRQNEMSDWLGHFAGGGTRAGMLIYLSEWLEHRLFIDAQSSLVSYTYNAVGEVLSKTEATGETTSYTYDTAGRLTLESRAGYRDQAGYDVTPRVHYAYDGLGNLVRSEQDGAGASGAWRVTSYAYGAGGRLQAMTDAGSNTRSYYYDIMGRKVGEAYPRVDSAYQTHYEGLSYEYDAAGNLVRQAFANVVGGLLTDADVHSGGVTTFTYDTYGELTSRSLNGVVQERNAYDNAGHLWRSTAGDGTYRYYMYDANGNRTLTLEDSGQFNGYTINRGIYDVLYIATNGNTSAVGAVFTANINATITAYDARGQAVSTNQAKRQLSAGSAAVDLVTTRAYDAFGGTVAETDALGNTTTYAYDTMGRAVRVTRAPVEYERPGSASTWDSPIDQLYYDVSGRLIGSRDANGRLTTRQLLAGTGYGGSEALVLREFHPDGGVLANGYDVFGDLRTASDALGRTTLNGYDALGRLTQVLHPAGGAGALFDYYVYDSLGQRTRHGDNAHNTVETTDYDRQGRVVATRAFGGELTATGYVWDGGIGAINLGTVYGGTITTVTYANGRSTQDAADTFGHALSHTDMAGRLTLFGYDSAGRLASREGADGAEGATQHYAYLNTGLAAGVSTGTRYGGWYFGGSYAERATARYGYDALGRKIRETATADGATTQDATASYDALGRMTAWSEAGTGLAPAAHVTWSYDAVGNVRHLRRGFHALDGGGTAYGTEITSDFWYAYDAMNRVTIDRGTIAGGQVVRGAGVSLCYDAAGQRRTARYDAVLSGTTRVQVDDPGGPIVIDVPLEGGGDPGSSHWEDQTQSYNGERQESYGWNADGTLAATAILTTGYDNGGGYGPVVSTGVLDRAGGSSNYGYDLLGRQQDQTDRDEGGAALYSHHQDYDASGRVFHDGVVQRQGSDTISVETRNAFGDGTADYALGAVVSSDTTSYRNGANYQASHTATDYAWYDGAVQSAVRYTPNTSQGTVYTTSYAYSGTGVLTGATINDGRPRSISVRSDALGQVLRRDEADTNYAQADPHDLWYRFDGRQIGHVGNDGRYEQGYAESLADRTHVQFGGTGAFRYGSTLGIGTAEFGERLTPIDTYAQGSAGGGSYTVRAGDSLAGIATHLWGDASLWYKLAQANGLSGDAGLVAGRALTIPAGVMRNTFDAGTLKPYDPSDAYGDTSPTTPKPQAAANRNKCGVFGQILLVVIAVAVTVWASPAALGSMSVLQGALAGAAGSLASQTVGLATGIQDKFDFKGLALSAIGGGVTAGLGNLGGISKGLGGISKTLTNGSFLSNVARGALSSAITQGIGVATGLQSKFDFAGVAAAGIGAGIGGAVGRRLGAGALSDSSARNIGANLLANTAGGLANAATRSLANGSDFGDNIMAALPDIIGNTIGNLIAGRVSTGGRRSPHIDLGDMSDLIYDDAVTAGGLGGAEAGITSNIAPTAAELTQRAAGRALDARIALGDNVSPDEGWTVVKRSSGRADNLQVEFRETFSITINRSWRQTFEALNTDHFRQTGKSYDNAESLRKAYQDREAYLWGLDAYATQMVDKPIGLALGGAFVTVATAGTGTLAAGYFGLTGWGAVAAGVGTDALAAGNGGLFYHALVGERNSVGSYGRDVLVGAGGSGVLRVGGAGVSSLVGRIGASGAASAERIALAQADQIAGGYAADEWGSTSLRTGDRVFGGLPGQSAYYTDAATLEASQGSRASLFQSLQVQAHPEFGYRSIMGEYEVTQSMRVPSGTALANPVHGVGGGNQYFIQNYGNSLRLVRQVPLGQ